MFFVYAPKLADKQTTLIKSKSNILSTDVVNNVRTSALKILTGKVPRREGQ